MHITLIKFITMLCGTDSIVHNISSFRLNVENILQNIVSPTKHFYEFEQCYAREWTFRCKCILLLIQQLHHIFMTSKMMRDFVDESMVFLERKIVLLRNIHLVLL